MEEKQTEWLPHLSKAVVADAHGNLLDAYAVALEGWRRGLKLRWHVKDSEKFKEMHTWFVDNPGQLFSLSSGEKTHYFFRTRGDAVTNEAVAIGKDKERTKEVLREAGIRVPEGRRFSPQESDQVIREFVSSTDYPVVLKPVDNSFGRGVIPNINNSEELDYALTYVRSELRIKDVILEKHIPGKEYRIYVVGNEVIGAINRIPANVVGDGKNTIGALITKKNQERSLNPRLISCPIKVDYEMERFLDKAKYSLDSVPMKNETVYLTDKSNISSGGDPIDVLDTLPAEIKKMAVETIHAIPGLAHGAVDLIIHPEKQIDQAGYVLEINPTAQIGSLLYPMQGKPRDIPAKIIDYYFPETIQLAKSKPPIYFDLKETLDPLEAAAVAEVAPVELKEWTFKKYTLTGKVHHLEFHQKVKEKALELFLIGSIHKVENKMIEIIVGGTDKVVVDNFSEHLGKLDDEAVIESIQESVWSDPVKLGFEIEGERKNLLVELDELENKRIELKTKQKRLEKHYHHMLTSNSWKLTEPFRKLGVAIKSIVGK